MAEKKGNSKIIWIILFAIITVLLCYLFTVVYFYFISPYNISAKRGLWPFGSDQTVGEMYMDSVVHINYKTVDDNFENVDVNVIGVNVRVDGYVLAPLSEFSNCSQDAQIKVFTNSGTAYNGVVAFEDKNRNLVVIKCESMSGGKVKIPYVAIGSLADCKMDSKVIMTSISTNARVFNSSIVGGVIVENGISLPVPKDVDGSVGYDFTVSHGFEVLTFQSGFNGGAVFNKKGKLLGLSFGRLLETTLPFDHFYIQPVYGALDYIKEVAGSKTGTYKNELVDAFCGFDVFEATDMIKTWGDELGKTTFYFDNTWNTITDDVTVFINSAEKGFHLFKEFDYKGKTIPQHSAITKVRVGKNTKTIEQRSDLFDTLFKAKKGDTVVLTYIELGDMTPKTLSLTV